MSSKSQSVNVDFQKSLAIAKEAIQLVGRFQTPPTPEVYEVWYRYVEGRNEPIQESVSHQIESEQAIQMEDLQALHQQFCTPRDDVGARVSTGLARGASELLAILAAQQLAGENFEKSIGATSNRLQETRNETDVHACITELLGSNSEMRAQLDRMKDRLDQSEQQISALREDLVASQTTMMTDPLTGVGNRRYYDTIVERAVGEASERAGKLFLMLLDLDEFKQINDTYGHAVGDQVLVFVPAKIREMRNDVSIARFGGDEFAVVFSDDSFESMSDFATQIRSYFATSALNIVSSGETLSCVRVSIGVACLRPDDDGDSWFGRADHLLLRVKESGRNTVMLERDLQG